ncbi:uncharacterized protein LOC134255559 isoform X1 [Saccostrea cucullata]|uniref:uncharacterized protein LOC134255559 isoform X1 n=2 Tax=Saccostrea cuccullata TaxID=36930 RepID=UPI002ED2F123
MRGSQRRLASLPALAPSIPPAFVNAPTAPPKPASSPSQESTTKFQGHYETEFIMANMDQGWAAKLLNPDKDRENLARVCWMLHDVGTHSLRAVFDSIHPPLNLKDHLAQPHIRTVLQRLHEQGVLDDKQWKLLYPTKKKHTTSQQYDSRTLATLLQTICHLCPPYPNGWSAAPLSADSSLSADIVRLQLMFQHVAEMKTISIEEYTSIWKQIREVLLRLGGPPIRVRLHRIENEVLDAEMQTHYISKVNESWGSNHKRLAFSPKSSSSRNTKGKTKRKNNAEQEGIPPEDKAVLMKTYKLFVDNIQAEDIIDRLQQNQVIKFSDRQEIFALSKRHERMQLLLDKILHSKLSYAFKALTDSIKFKYKKIHETVVQIRKETYKHGIRETVDVVGVVTTALTNFYKNNYSKCSPFPWNESITCNIRDMYTPLEIMDQDGKRLHLSDFLPPVTTAGKGQRILLEGPSGSGKTILSHMVAYMWATQRSYFKNKYGILLHVDLKKMEGDFQEQVHHNLLPEDFKLNPSEFFSMLEANASEVLLILDGYDGRISQRGLEDILSGIHLRQANVIVMMNPEIVSSPGFIPDSRLFSLGYSMNNVSRCMKTYLYHYKFNPENHQRLFDTVTDENWQFRPFITKPICCLLIFAIYQSSKNAKIIDITGLTSLMEAYGFAMATQFCKRQKLDIIGLEFPEEVVRAIDQLSTFAFRTLNDEEYSFTEEGIHKDTQNAIVFKLGAFFKLTPVSKWMFTCSLMHDFLAARHLSDYVLEEMTRVIRDHRMMKQSRYNQLVMFTCGLYRNDHDTPVIRQLFSEMAVQNIRHTRVESEDSDLSEEETRPLRPPSGRFNDFAQSLQSLAEAKFREDALEAVAQSFPPRTVIKRDGLLPYKSLLSLPYIMLHETNRITHLEIHLIPVFMCQIHLYTDFAEGISKSKVLAHLKLVWSSMDVLARFLDAFMKTTESIESVILQDACKKPVKQVSAATWATLQNACQNMTKCKNFAFLQGKVAAISYFVLQHLPDTIQELDFTGCVLNMMCASELSSKVEQANCLEVLDISQTSLFGSAFVAVLQGLKLSNSMKTLKLRGAKLDRVGVITLAECLRLTRTLQVLDLSDCELNTDMCKTLTDAIAENHSLRKLVLKNTKVTIEGRQAIVNPKLDQLTVVGLDDMTYALQAVNVA